MKLIVNAICKNEAKHIPRFLKAIKDEVDALYILDTGSTDNTVELLSRTPAITVRQKVYDEFDFETARNDALAMIPEDRETIIFSLDLDEVPQPGFGKVIRQAFSNPSITRARYRFNWSLLNGVPQIFFNSEKVWRHGLGYKWRFLVHERLVPEGFDEVWAEIPIVVDHLTDNSKSRSSYLPLLRRNYQRYPSDQRSALYLGRELYFYSHFQESLNVLHRYLLMDNLWIAEKAYAYRLIAKCYLNLKQPQQALTNLNEAITLYPQSRDNYLDLCFIYYSNRQWGFLAGAALQGLQIKDRPLDYMESNEGWSGGLEDYLSIAYWNLGLKRESLVYACKALECNPTNNRLINNYKAILKGL